MTKKTSVFHIKPHDFFKVYNSLPPTFTNDEFINKAQELLSLEPGRKQVQGYLQTLGFKSSGTKEEQHNKAAVLCRNSERCFLRRKSKQAKIE
ncbi:TPA: hypothetical protein ACGUPM_002638 [Vibrio vulnificus]